MRIPLPPCCLLLVVLEEAYTGSCVLLLLLLDESWRLTKGREGRDWRIGNGLFQVPQSLHRPPHPSPALPSPPRIVAGNYASSRHAISLSMLSPMLATGAGFRHAARSCRTTIHPSLSLSAKFANGGLTEWSGALSSTPACRPGFEPPRGQIFQSRSAGLILSGMGQGSGNFSTAGLLPLNENW